MGTYQPTLGPTPLRSAALCLLIGHGELHESRIERVDILVLICPLVWMHLHRNVQGVPHIVLTWRASFLCNVLSSSLCSQAVVLPFIQLIFDFILLIIEE